MGDLISREALRDKVRTLKVNAEPFQNLTYKIGYISALSTVEGLLAYADAVEVVRHAKWEEYPDRAHIRCTGCRVEFKKEKMPMSRAYCPNCGAKMDKEAEK